MAFSVGASPTLRARQPREARDPLTQLLIPPASYLIAVRKALGDIDLDPASSDIGQQHIDAASWYRASDAMAALAEPWAGRVFLHPHPDLRLCRLQIQKLLRDYLAGRVTAALILNLQPDLLRVEPLLLSFPFALHYRRLTFWRYEADSDELVRARPTNHPLSLYFPSRCGNHFADGAVERFCAAFRGYGRPVIAEDLGDDWQAEAMVQLSKQPIAPLLPSARLERYGDRPGALADLLQD